MEVIKASSSSVQSETDGVVKTVAKETLTFDSGNRESDVVNGAGRGTDTERFGSDSFK